MYFSDAMVSILTEVVSCRRSYLLLDNNEEDRVLYETSCRGNQVDIEQVDYRLLDLIVVNGRLPVVDLAKKLDCSSQTVNYRLKGLAKKGIIKAFRVAIDDSKLGLQDCAIDIYLKDHSKKKQVIDYIIKNPHVYDLMTKTIGWTDVSFQMMIERMDDIFNMMDRLEQQFPNSIRKQNYWMSQKIHKERWLPEMTKRDFEIT
jgi:DNA-binding Lrp family transcriptional regulator